MKALKDIGHLLSRHPVDGGLIPFDKDLAEPHHVIVLTLQDRREFAQLLIDAWSKKVFGERNATVPSIEEFLKEQGL